MLSFRVFAKVKNALQKFCQERITYEPIVINLSKTSDSSFKDKPKKHIQIF